MISVVIPAYNEERVLAESAQAVTRFLEQLSPLEWEIILVDDGSCDQTSAVAALLAEDPRFRPVHHLHNRGKGAAVRTGVMHTRGDMVLICDADLSTPLRMLTSFMQELSNGADIVTGDRRCAAASIERNQSSLRRLLGWIYAALARQVSGVPLRDFNCGFKLFRGGAARSLLAQCQSERWTWDVEVIALAVRGGLTVRALPVTWRQGDRSAVRPFRAAAESFADIGRLWIRLHRGV